MTSSPPRNLQLYNTLTRRKEVFEPLVPGKVGMYVCGMTIYDYCHMGHARMLMAFDVVQRWLRTLGYELTYVRNITDIDDKIIKRALDNGETIGALTARFAAIMAEDLARLGIEPPDVEPRATQYVPQMIDIIERLQHGGLAYQAQTGEGAGDVNFSVRRFAGYGRLSGKSIDELHAGHRVASAEGKEDPLDFVLWKRAKPEEPPEAKWPSPWGDGRPGWHIECSAMSCAILGRQFDIHGGGEDLQFPHHENEIAQSDGAFHRDDGQTFARYWLHNGFLNVDDTKMSKSLNNFFTIRSVLEHYDAEVLRYFLVRTHYRSQFNYADTLVQDAKQALTRFYLALEKVAPDAAPLDWDEPHAQRFAAAMNDDFNTPVALAVLFDLLGELNKTQSPALARQLLRLAAVLGLLQREPAAFLRGAADAAFDQRIEAKVAERLAAKKAKDYATADRLRAELLAEGIIIEDSAAGSSWRRA